MAKDILDINVKGIENRETQKLETLPFYQVSLDSKAGKLESVIGFAKEFDNIMEKEDVQAAEKAIKEANRKILEIVHARMIENEKKAVKAAKK